MPIGISERHVVPRTPASCTDSLALKFCVPLLLVLLPLSVLLRLGVPERAVAFCFSTMDLFLDGFETCLELRAARILSFPLLLFQIKVVLFASERSSSGQHCPTAVSFVLLRTVL